MIDAVYNSKLLELASNIGATTRLHTPDASASAHSKLCGSTVTIDLRVDDKGVVTDYGQHVRACALGQATASIMAEQIIGTHGDELRDTRSAAYAMLKENAPAPDGRFADLKYLEPVREYKARHASTLLVFDAVIDALDEIEAKRGLAVPA
ncbi:MAG: iron-sulfur cluster assembly scaffold protein [Pseudomonadota bacterium]